MILQLQLIAQLKGSKRNLYFVLFLSVYHVIQWASPTLHYKRKITAEARMEAARRIMCSEEMAPLPVLPPPFVCKPNQSTQNVSS
ncbi:hypothetical protein SKAU_G00069720 [Synaphobranchus kaupii]|uniref:Uncharacterized protein n=1 Tax=Synaphobranchus kaupii TaxID=118154 RepID=A0A9Q1G7K3_SYNKA|nr:hypothetical protein SKAU_G00069720 [Synaphobranchus kaupii]